MMIAELTLRDASGSGGNLTRSHDGKASGLVLRVLSQLWKVQCDAPLVCLESRKNRRVWPDKHLGFKAIISGYKSNELC